MAEQYSCAVVNCCVATSFKSKSIFFHPFPRDDTEMCKMWMRLCGRKEMQKKYLCTKPKVCSLHFADRYITSRNILRPTAIPTENLNLTVQPLNLPPRLRRVKSIVDFCNSPEFHTCVEASRQLTENERNNCPNNIRESHSMEVDTTNPKTPNDSDSNGNSSKKVKNMVQPNAKKSIKKIPESNKLADVPAMTQAPIDPAVADSNSSEGFLLLQAIDAKLELVRAQTLTAQILQEKHRKSLINQQEMHELKIMILTETLRTMQDVDDVDNISNSSLDEFMY